MIYCSPCYVEFGKENIDVTFLNRKNYEE
jgi:hypothetical protein